MNRILVVHPHLYITGGSEELTKILIRELRSRGLEIAVVTKDIDEDINGVEVWRFKNAAEKIDGLRPVLESATSTLYDAIDSFSPDSILIMIHEPVYASISKIINPKIPVGIYIHYPKEEEASRENISDFITMYRFPIFDPKMYLIPDVHMVNSAYTARTLYRLYGIESNIVYPCIDWGYINEEPDLESPREPIIISVGRIVPHKNFEAIIDIFRRYIAPKLPRSRLIIAGSPDPRFRWYLEKLKSISETDDRIELHISPSRRKLISLYQESSIYLHARIGEHFGMAPLEAISQGAIGIVPSRSGIAEVMNEGSEVIVYNSLSEVPQKILYVFSLDRYRLKKLRSKARFKALFHNPERFAKEVLNYLSIPSADDHTRDWGGLA